MRKAVFEGVSSLQYQNNITICAEYGTLIAGQCIYLRLIFHLEIHFTIMDVGHGTKAVLSQHITIRNTT